MIKQLFSRRSEVLRLITQEASLDILPKTRPETVLGRARAHASVTGDKSLNDARARRVMGELGEERGFREPGTYCGLGEPNPSPVCVAIGHHLSPDQNPDIHRLAISIHLTAKLISLRRPCSAAIIKCSLSISLYFATCLHMFCCLSFTIWIFQRRS